MPADRAFKGVWIPKEIWDNEDISLVDKCLLAEINSLDKGDGCFAGNQHLADFLRVSVPTITRSISRLKTMGFLEEIDAKERRVRVINLMTLPNQNDVAPNQNDEDYICISNTTSNTVSNKAKKAASNDVGKSLSFTSEELDELQAKYPTVNVEKTRQEAVLWLEETGNTKKSYRAFFTRWLMNQVRYQERDRLKRTPQPKTAPKHIYEA